MTTWQREFRIISPEPSRLRSQVLMSETAVHTPGHCVPSGSASARQSPTVMSDDEDTSVHSRMSDSEGGFACTLLLLSSLASAQQQPCTVENESSCAQSDQSSEEDEDSSCQESSKKQDVASEARELQQRREANITAMLTNR